MYCDLKREGRGQEWSPHLRGRGDMRKIGTSPLPIRGGDRAGKTGLPISGRIMVGDAKRGFEACELSF